MRNENAVHWATRPRQTAAFAKVTADKAAREVAGVSQFLEPGQPPPASNVHAALMSLPRLCRLRQETIPGRTHYLTVPPPPNASRFLHGLRTGCAWASSGRARWRGRCGACCPARRTGAGCGGGRIRRGIRRCGYSANLRRAIGRELWSARNSPRPNWTVNTKVSSLRGARVVVETLSRFVPAD
jgi:hypothetical protein